MSYTNKDRAESVAAPLAMFAEAQGITDEDTRTQLHDLLSNTAHAVAAADLNPAEEFARALYTYEEERAEAVGEEMAEAGRFGSAATMFDAEDQDGDALRVTMFTREARGTEEGAVFAIFAVNEEQSAGITEEQARELVALLTEALAR